MMGTAGLNCWPTRSCGRRLGQKRSSSFLNDGKAGQILGPEGLGVGHEQAGLGLW